MTEVIRTYRQELPAMRFIGKKYGGSEVGHSEQWAKWFERGWFEPLERVYKESPAGVEDDDAYLGLIRCSPGSPFEYWIGMFFSVDAEVPVGYQSVEFAPFELGVAWLHGPESELYSQEEKAMEALARQGIRPSADSQGAFWFVERYACPRFTQPDDNGDVTLDMGLISGWKDE